MPDPCASIQQEIDDLAHQIQLIQDSPDYIQGANGPHPGWPDPALLRQVKQLLAKVETANGQLNACEIQHGGKPAITSQFKGTATVTTSNGDAPGPFLEPFDLTLQFLQWQHTTLNVTELVPITVGPVVITLNQQGQGTCNPESGLLSMALSLHLQINITFAHDSDVTITLSTDNHSPKGSRMNAAGQMTVAGTGWSRAARSAATR